MIDKRTNRSDVSENVPRRLRVFIGLDLDTRQQHMAGEGEEHHPGPGPELEPHISELALHDRPEQGPLARTTPPVEIRGVPEPLEMASLDDPAVVVETPGRGRSQIGIREARESPFDCIRTGKLRQKCGAIIEQLRIQPQGLQPRFNVFLLHRAEE